jgi:hypothetical protein
MFHLIRWQQLRAFVIGVFVVLTDLQAINFYLYFLGTDGGLDFDAVRVSEEAKQVCSLKNKGKYDISYA